MSLWAVILQDNQTLQQQLAHTSRHSLHSRPATTSSTTSSHKLSDRSFPSGIDSEREKEDRSNVDESASGTTGHHYSINDDGASSIKLIPSDVLNETIKGQKRVSE